MLPGRDPADTGARGGAACNQRAAGEPAADRQWHLLGYLDAAPAASRLEVSLVRQGTSLPTAEWVADEHGVYGFSAEPGRYDLVVRHGDSVILLPNIEIR